MRVRADKCKRGKELRVGVDKCNVRGRESGSGKGSRGREDHEREKIQNVVIVTPAEVIGARP